MAPNGAMPCTRAQTAKSATQPTHLTPPAVKHISGPSESYWMVRRSILDPICILDFDFEVLGTSKARPDPIIKLQQISPIFMTRGSRRTLLWTDPQKRTPRLDIPGLFSENVTCLEWISRCGIGVNIVGRGSDGLCH